MIATVDLSRFISLKELTLRFLLSYFDNFATSLVSILSTITTHQLEKLSIQHIPHNRQSLDSTLAALSGLKDAVDILSLPRFHHLHHIQFEFYFSIMMQEHHTISYFSPYTSSRSTILTSGSSSQQDFDDNDSTNDPHRTFKRYAEDIVRSKMEEELRELSSRGILDINVGLQIIQDEKPFRLYGTRRSKR